MVTNGTQRIGPFNCSTAKQELINTCTIDLVSCILSISENPGILF